MDRMAEGRDMVLESEMNLEEGKWRTIMRGG